MCLFVLSFILLEITFLILFMVASVSLAENSIPSHTLLRDHPVQNSWSTFILGLGARVASSVTYWAGITDLQKGCEKVSQKKYLEGTCHLLKGSVHVLVLGIVVKRLFSLSVPSYLRGSSGSSSSSSDMRSEDNFFEGPKSPESTRWLGPIPDVKPAREYSYCEGKKNPITIVTAYNDAIKEYAEPILENQRAYAQKHGYCYVVYTGNLAHDDGIARAPYWSKIVAIWDQWKKSTPGSWIVWMDASAIITNTDKTFTDIIYRYGRDRNHVILTKDAMPQWGIPINNAVFALRRNSWTKDWISKIWSRSDLSLGGEENCGTLYYPHCHYEQQAMTELWQKNSDVKQHTSLIPNREMNSFYRFSHDDQKRNMRLDYYQDDKETFHWHVGDFICKITGMEGRLRTPMTQFVLNECIDKSCILPYDSEDVTAYQRKHSNLRSSS